jgi:UDP-perosamine 4-acetyltransferase
MKVVLYGAGGHARVVLDAARAQGLDVIAVLDDRVELHGSTLDGVEVIGGEGVLNDLRGRGVEGAILGVGSIEATPVRAALYERIATRGLALPVVRHPTAVVASSARLGDATVVLAGAVINPHAQVGRNVIVNTAAVIEHDCVIGDHAHVAPGALLAGDVWVGSGTHVGIGAVIIQGVRIGANAVVGAGAVVLRDVGDGQRVAGVPARPLA